MPESASLASYQHAPPRIQDNIVTVPALRAIPRMPAATDFGGAPEPVAAPEKDSALTEVPFLACTSGELLVAKLDHREGFVLSLVDGKSSVESVIDACPMQADETRRILVELQMRGLVAVRTTRRRAT